ncbi:LysR family transcriptional regulator [Pseudoduganella namucuonensis]|uniref:DNA-binding transcriptional regulator, LysR family n=1 Tax=Pseudoduganella namucuonensis TaxID=1035707 RepID=A0A1I7FN88_9BURK|nr:LysR family transcriptional regulator [Pseudoduganella namucuonensis]SFU37496.1 DNA-binding transcriptional regulator, LysR family [Pseudoduganella namucuonensis]
MIQPSELSFFVRIVKEGSLSAAARELGVTPASVSKRLTRLEEDLGVPLLSRTTRRLSVTDEGELYYAHALKILGELEELERLLSQDRAAPKGLLRLNAPLGFGRTYITPVVSNFIKRYPDVEVQLQLTDHPLSLADDAFDIGIRFGDVPDARVVATMIAANRRLVCAAPSYLRKFGVPKVPNDLARFNCIVLRQNDAAYGTWRFTKGRGSQTVKVRGTLSSNDGEVALNWALDGHGLMLRAEWDIAKYLRSGRLQIVLEDYASPPADIYAVYHEKHRMSPRVKVFTEFLAASFQGPTRGARSGPAW